MKIEEAPKVFGTQSFNMEVEEALAAGGAVSLDPRCPPRFTCLTPPSEMYNSLFIDLKLVAAYSTAWEKLFAALEADAPAEEYERIAAEAERGAEPFKGHYDYAALSKVKSAADRARIFAAAANEIRELKAAGAGKADMDAIIADAAKWTTPKWGDDWGYAEMLDFLRQLAAE